MRYLLTFSYDGSLFHGFQRQNNEKNVQGTIEKALSKLLNSNIVIKGSGRTDALVHATCQCAHFDVEHKLNKSFKKTLNKELNKEIIIKKIKKVNNNFHARFSVKEKEYIYVINLDKKKINDNYYFTSFKNLNLKKMKEAAKAFLKVHDFRNFVSGQRDDYHTYIKKITIKKKGNLIIFKFIGTGFYRYMVRHLVGALYDVGREKASVLDIKNRLDVAEIKPKMSIMPAYGLYLTKIKY